MFDPTNPASVLRLVATAPRSDASPVHAEPDAGLTTLCNRLIENKRETSMLCRRDEHAPDRGPFHARYEELLAERRAIEAKIYEAEWAASPAAMTAVAKAALTMADRDASGELSARDLFEWLSLAIVEALAGPDFAAEQVRLERNDRYLEGAYPEGAPA